MSICPWTLTVTRANTTKATPARNETGSFRSFIASSRFERADLGPLAGGNQPEWWGRRFGYRGTCRCRAVQVRRRISSRVLRGNPWNYCSEDHEAREWFTVELVDPYTIVVPRQSRFNGRRNANGRHRSRGGARRWSLDWFRQSPRD